MQEVEAHHGAADKNGDGQVSQGELTAAIAQAMQEHKGSKLAQVGRKMPKAGQMWELLTSLMDTNDDDMISGQEAQAALDWLNEHGKAVFDHIDSNNNGEIDQKEFVSAWNAQFGGSKLAQRKGGKPSWEDALKHDTNNDGKIDWEEVEKVVPKKHAKVAEVVFNCAAGKDGFVEEKEFEAAMNGSEDFKSCIESHMKEHGKGPKK